MRVFAHCVVQNLSGRGIKDHHKAHYEKADHRNKKQPVERDIHSTSKICFLAEPKPRDSTIKSDLILQYKGTFYR